MFINEAYAAAQPLAQTGSVSGALIQLGLILLIFYFFLIRPQQRKIKAHSEMVQALKVGDYVLTNGGIYGKITKVEENEVALEVANGVVIKVDRMSVGGLAEPTEKKAEKKVEKSAGKPKKTSVKTKK